MKRTVLLSDSNTPDCLTVIFKEGRKKIASFTYWNYHKYTEVLARKTADFIKYGIIPKEQDGFIEL